MHAITQRTIRQVGEYGLRVATVPQQQQEEHVYSDRDEKCQVERARKIKYSRDRSEQIVITSV